MPPGGIRNYEMLEVKETEAHIQKAIMQWGQYKKVLVDGIPVSVWLEVKTKKGKLSPNQKAFQESVEAAGGYYYVVRSIDDVDLAIQQTRLDVFTKMSTAIPF